MGRIPLYKHDEINLMPENANAGLWYDKFCDQWKSWKDGVGDNKSKWINMVTGKSLGNTKEIEVQVERRKNLTKSNSGIYLLFRTDGKFVTGMGRNHPVENGFTWHHTLGIPYIPGTSVKGVVRDWAKNLIEDGIVNDDLINRIFGPEERNKDGYVGSVIFLDAIPYSPIQLSADIMTPHYGPYYSEGKEVPGDWHDPVPIPFLVVDNGQEFLFGLIPRNEEASEDVRLVEKWLIKALDESGAGAKTNVGYGRFKKIEIKSPADQWLANTAKEVNIELSKITSNPSRAVIETWMNIEDPELKSGVANNLKRAIIAENNWDIKSWGQLEKLKKALKEFLGE